METNGYIWPTYGEGNRIIIGWYKILRGANGMENKYVISCHKNCLFFLLFIFALFAFKRDAPVGERLCIVCNPGRVPNPEPSISYVL